MNKRTINNIMSKKFDAWLKTIDDENLRNMVRNNSFITGGSIASLLLGEDVNDYDVYFANQETAVAVAKYYANKYNTGKDNAVNVTVDDNGIIVLFIRAKTVVKIEYADSVLSEDNDSEDEKTVTSLQGKKGDKSEFNMRFMTNNAITLTGDIQCIFRFYGDIDEIHSNFL